MADKKENDQDKQPLTFGRVLNLANQGVESMVASTLSLPALVADGYLNIYRAGRQAAGGQAFEASNLFERSKKAIINAGRELDGTAGKVVGPQNGTEEKIVLGADIASSIIIPTGLAGLATKTKTVATVSNAARIEPTLGATTTAKTAQTSVDVVKKTKSVDTLAVEDVTARLAAAKKAGEAERAGQAVAKTAAPAEKAAVETLEVAAEKSAAAAKATDPAVKSVLDGKAKAGLGERTKNAINRTVEDSNLATRLAVKPVAAVAGAAVSNPVKTIIAADLAANVVSASVNPVNPDQSLAYNAGQKTVKDMASIASAGVKILSYIPVIGAPIAAWAYNNAKPAASTLYQAAGDAMDGSVDQLAQEMGFDADLSKVRIPGASIPGKIAAASRNQRVEQARQTAEEKVAALRENAGDVTGQAVDGAKQVADDVLDGEMMMMKQIAGAIGISEADLDPRNAKETMKRFAGDNKAALAIGTLAGVKTEGGIMKKGLVGILTTAIMAPLLKMFEPYLQAIGQLLKPFLDSFKSHFTQYAQPASAPTSGAPAAAPKVSATEAAPGLDVSAPAIKTDVALNRDFGTARTAKPEEPTPVVAMGNAIAQIFRPKQPAMLMQPSFA